MTAALKIAGRSYVNGTPVDDVQALLNTIVRRPAAGLARWRMASAWRGRMRSSSRADGFEIGGQSGRRPYVVEADAPRELGGTDNFASPQELLLAALNACLTGRIAMLCALEGVEIWRLEVASEGELDLRGALGVGAGAPVGLAALTSRISVRGPAPAGDYRRIAEAAVATSPIAQSLSAPVAVAVDLAPA